jgi:ABC-type sugar transport system ATPase subunit
LLFCVLCEPREDLLSLCGLFPRRSNHRGHGGFSQSFTEFLSMDLLKLSGIYKQLNESLVLSDISFAQQPFQKIAIAGETGAGKTILLKIIAGLVQKDSGSITFENEKLLGPDEKLIAGSDGIAYISQNFELRNNYRVEEELAYTRRLTDKEASAIFEICRISHLLKRWTDELSGGEKQRIVTARALIAAPRLLLLDEPFSNLDIAHRQIMKEVINEITENLRTACILVSHDPLDILSWADKILLLKKGKLIQQGDPRQLYLQPINEYAASLLGRYNLIDSKNSWLFSNLPAIDNNGKHMLIRPEFFKIVKDDGPSVKAVIKKIVFFGSYLEIDAQVKDIIITLIM